MSFAIIYITHENEQEARKIANHLLRKKMVACSNIFPISSSYWWQGAIQHEGEFVSIVKTTLSNCDAVKEEVENIHPYDLPCIMIIEVEANEAYEQWIKDSINLEPPGASGKH